MKRLLQSLSYPVLIILCLTLGLAPFVPEPHLWQKLQMLLAGTLSRPVDIFDLIMHGLPFLLLLARIIFTVKDSS